MKKILIVFGTRPEAIKMAPLVREFLTNKDKFVTKICITAQHREMLDQVMSIFDIKADYDLNIMSPNQDLFLVTQKVLSGVREVIVKEVPDVVLVHGDTTTAFASALAAFYCKVPVGHVEAGLRTYNIDSPWPEEFNRQAVDRITTYYFSPTRESGENLLDEKVESSKIFVTGNTVIDALLYVRNLIESDVNIEKKAIQTIIESGYTITDRKFILVTGHRRENFGYGFREICMALKEIAMRHPNIDVIYPVHLNPNVQKPVYEYLSLIKNVYLTSPLDYIPFVYLMQKCHLVLTDSGGIQEEAPTFGKPVLVMRDTTERPEAVQARTAKLVGANAKSIIRHVDDLLSDNNLYQQMANAHNPYGYGTACKQIVEILGK